MSYSPKSIANYFLDLAHAQGEAIDPMKLQKLVYYAQGWYAGYTGEQLINDTVQAWPYGPVIPSLYHEFKRFGSAPIHGRAMEWGREVERPEDPQLRGFLDNIWNSYGQYSGLRLSDMTHAPDGPWDLTRRQSRGGSPPIPFEVIRDHFREATSKAQDAQ